MQKKGRNSVAALVYIIVLLSLLLSHDESVDSNGCETKPNKGGEDNADDLEPLHPCLVVPTYCLEHTPESVAKMEPDRAEPYYIDDKHPYIAESCCQEQVWILSLASAEFFELHLCPEMGEMEEEDAEDYDTEYEHVLG